MDLQFEQNGRIVESCFLYGLGSLAKQKALGHFTFYEGWVLKNKINVKWRYGDMTLRFANMPHPDNPHTSALAVWAAIRLLQTLLQ